MCGIAGWYRRTGGPVGPATITAQCDAIVHRGPDDSGVFTDRDFGFGMRRLSILDIGGGHQPITSEDERFTIIFNGEIYNHRELRPHLAALGHRFVSQSDTETILAAFIAWGNDTWAKLEGMFAVAIWDHARRELTLARDPLGIKPLYVTEQHGGLAFASELKSLRLLPGHRFDVADRAVHDFFSFGHVRKPRSIFRQVRMLDPGTFLTMGPSGEGRSGVFWRPRLHAGQAMSSGDWIAQLQSMLLETTRRHMQADVPVAAFLSGGIDSSAVLAAMRRATDQPLKAFTIGYPGAKIDESAAAARIAHHLGCEHIVLPLDPAAAAEALPQIQRCYDEPFADMAAIPTWYASKVAAEHVKVVLCGEGGDELFAGYKRHRNARNIERLRPIMGAADPLAGLLGRMPTTRSPWLNVLRQNADRFTEFVRLADGFPQFFAATQISRQNQRRRIYSRDFAATFESGNPYEALGQEYFPAGTCPSASALEQFLFADLTLNMPSAMLTRLDRASMAHSVEARVPLLSHKFVDWAMTVPAELKLRGNTGKYILREAIRPWLPADILTRPKQGFQMPLASWMRGSLGQIAREAWNDGGAAAAGYLDPDAVDEMFREHRSGSADHSRMLYAIAVFGLWWRDGRAVTPVLADVA
jgi:asparagine synthase (glutamine-hydrolysing)